MDTEYKQEDTKPQDRRTGSIDVAAQGSSARGLFEFCLNIGNVFAKSGFEFAADDVGGEAGAEEAAVEGGEFLFIEFAAEGAQFAVDALADDCGLVGVLSRFFEGGFDVTVGDSAGT